MAQGRDPRKDARKRKAQRARDNYRREAERKRAERMKGKDLKVPPFNPEEFIRLERLRSKAMLLTISYSAGVTAGLIALGELVGQPFGFAIVALLLLGSLYPYLKWVWDIDMTKLGRWSAPLGMWFAYFVTFLMVSFIMSNPPLIDYASPEIHCCEYWTPTNNTSEPWVLNNETTVPLAAGQVRIVAHVIDNHEVAGVRIQFADPQGNRTSYTDMTRGAGTAWEFVLPQLELNDYTLFFQATDDAGHLTEASASMRVV